MSKQHYGEMRDFSIDLETLGTRYNAPIISIGVQQFDAWSGRLGDSFYREIDFDSAVKAGCPSGSAIAWWMQQGEAARRIFDGKKKVYLAVALDELSQWMRKCNANPVVWGNGATFDITILEYAYEAGAVGQREPWNFRNVRDMRTICDLAALSDDEWPARIGTHHHALDDAAHQARIISVAHAKIRRGLAALQREGKTTKVPSQPERQPQEEDEEL